jgi:hypothetical protein
MSPTPDWNTELARTTWLEPWQRVAAGQASQLQATLQRQLVSGHVLFGRGAQAIARSDDDQVLYLLQDPQQLAVVHLSSARSKTPDQPHSMLFDSVAEFVEGCMRPDHEELTDPDADDS